MSSDVTRIGTAALGTPLPGARGEERRRQSRARRPVLTVLCHPSVERVGEVAPLDELTAGRGASLSRAAPLFAPPGGGGRRPLADRYLSRGPIRLLPARRPGDLLLVVGESRTPVTVDGQPVEEASDLPAEAVERGVVLELAGRVVLLLHTLPADAFYQPEEFDLVGHSEGISQVRREIRRVADLEVPVLLRGETGTGKELVARGIHAAGRRAQELCLTVNLGAIPPSLAVSELFGAVKGAFTGAVRSQMGYFQRAHGGTLFLDEVGEAPADVQVLLLRALESGEIQRVGSPEPQRVDVRLIAATDAELEEAIAAGRFKAPLLHRLSGYEIHLPPLRRRRDDFGRLLFHFLRRELAETGEEHHLESPDPMAKPWMPASIVARLVRYDWPGNVRQLRNVVRQLVIASRGAERLQVSPQVERLLQEVAGSGSGEEDVSAIEISPPEVPAPEPQRQRARPGRYRKPSDVSQGELLEALRAHRFEIKPTAARLGISRASLYALIDRCPGLRKASEVSRGELLECHEQCGGDLTAMAERLEVSASGLQQRLRQLGIG